MFTINHGRRHFKNMLAFMDSESRFSYINRETGLLVSDPEELKKMNANATYWNANMSNAVFHSWAVQDGSFLRLNNVVLGYSLPKSLLSKLSIEQLRLYVSGYNLWVWTHYPGYDPEVDAERSTPLTPGIDYCAYPRSRTYNIGVNITF
jgi:hypothetical protein